MKSKDLGLGLGLRIGARRRSGQRLLIFWQSLKPSLFFMFQKMRALWIYAAGVPIGIQSKILDLAASPRQRLGRLINEIRYGR